MKLFIIGNGFDSAHKYETKYSHYRKYLQENEDENNCLGDFSLTKIFEDATDEDWNSFEELLGKYNFEEWASFYTESINQGETESIQEKKENWNKYQCENFYEINQKLSETLKKTLCTFISIQTSDKKKTKDVVTKNIKPMDLFITFNYSLLLENLYDINPKRILHIHNSIRDEKQIIFGHGITNLQVDSKFDDYDFNTPETMLKNVRARLKKDYQTQRLLTFVKNKNVSTIIIMGHSLGQIDQVYFQKLHNLYSMAKIIFYFYYDKNLKDSHGRPITKEKQRDNYKKQLQNLFGLKSDIKIKEW